MAEEICWRCGRNKEQLVLAMPPGFWDEQQPMFDHVELIGRLSRVDTVRPDDPRHNRHFARPDTPADEVCSFDDRRYAVVMRKRQTVSVCRICRTLDQVARMAGEGIPHHAIYPAGSDDAAVSRAWERARTEARRREAEFPDDAYRVLSAIKVLDHRASVTLWDLSERMFVFNHRSLETPVLHILSQCPELGELDRRNLVLHFKDPQKARGMVQGLLDRYEEFYRQQEVATPVSQPQAVLARIKKLNNPADVFPYALR